MSNTNENYIKTWLRGCSAIDANNRLRVDYLGENAVEYSLISSPSSIAYKENVLGEMIPQLRQQVNYIFAARLPYGQDTETNAANLDLFKNIINWIIEQNNNRNLPEMIDGKITAVVPTLTPFVAVVGADAAKYQIQLQITYRRV